MLVSQRNAFGRLLQAAVRIFVERDGQRAPAITACFSTIPASAREPREPGFLSREEKFFIKDQGFRILPLRPAMRL